VRLPKSEPTFIASEAEAVWELADHRWLVVEQNAEHAGNAMQIIFVDDLEALVTRVGESGIEPVKWECPTRTRYATRCCVTPIATRSVLVSDLILVRQHIGRGPDAERPIHGTGTLGYTEGERTITLGSHWLGRT
jgi:hypothetical protein